jgi:hypothetical protein
MSPLEKIISAKAKLQARELLKTAYKNEPEITLVLAEIASNVSAEMVGLEHKFKTEESLTEKLAKNAQKYLSYISDEQDSDSIEKSVARIAQQNNDVLRYTFLIPIENYVFCFKKTLTELGNLDYKISKQIWNAWKNIGTKYDKGYRGINSSIISSQGQKFELQFHTGESFQLKMQTHELYKESGLAATSSERKVEIAQIILESAKIISIPQGVKKL